MQLSVKHGWEEYIIEAMASLNVGAIEKLAEISGAPVDIVSQTDDTWAYKLLFDRDPPPGTPMNDGYWPVFATGVALVARWMNTLGTADHGVHTLYEIYDTCAWYHSERVVVEFVAGYAHTREYIYGQLELPDNMLAHFASFGLTPEQAKIACDSPRLGLTMRDNFAFRALYRYMERCRMPVWSGATLRSPAEIAARIAPPTAMLPPGMFSTTSVIKKYREYTFSPETPAAYDRDMVMLCAKKAYAQLVQTNGVDGFIRNVTVTIWTDDHEASTTTCKVDSYNVASHQKNVFICVHRAYTLYKSVTDAPDSDSDDSGSDDSDSDSVTARDRSPIVQIRVAFDL